MTLDDLIGVCGGCSGTGKKPQQDTSGGGGGFGRRSTTFALGLSPEECGPCLGTGRRGLTETGRALVELLRVIRKYEDRNMLNMLTHAGGERGEG